MRSKAVIIGLISLVSAQAFAASTVNSYTPSEADRARAAVRKAGYTPEAIAQVKDKNSSS